MIAYKFGPFLLQQGSPSLTREDTPLSITKRSHEILLMLIERRGQTVTKDEIMQNVWPGQIVEESNIAQQIYTLRRLIGDDSRNQRYIETIPGIGYRFKAEVEMVDFTPPAVRPAEEPPEQVVVPRSRSVKPLLLLALFLILGGAGIAIQRTIQSKGINPRAWFRIGTSGPSSPNISPLLTLPGIESHPAFSPNGRYLSFTWDGDRNSHDIYYIDLEESGVHQPRQLSRDPALEHQGVWSPDSREIAFLRIPKIPEERYHLIVAPLDGGPEREVGRVWGGLDWSPDGKYFAVSDSEPNDSSTRIFLLSADGQSRRPVTQTGQEVSVFETFPRFSPNGETIALVRWRSDQQGDIFLAEVGSGVTRQLTFDNKSISDLKWADNGRKIIFCSNRQGNRRLWQIDAAGGTPEPALDIPYQIDTFAVTTGPSAEKRLAFTNSIEDTTILVGQIPPPGGRFQACRINSSRIDSDPQFSPDNQQISFTSTRSGTSEIWIAQSDCTNPRRLTSLSDISLGAPRWSPDGKSLIFNRHDVGTTSIYAIDLDGANLRQISNSQYNDFTPVWSTDGQWIYFTSIRQGKYEIWRLPAKGGEAIQITRGGGRIPYPSPDGRYLYFTRHEILRRIDLRNNRDEAIPGLESTIVERYWHPARDHIYFSPVKAVQKAAIFRLSLQSRTIEKLIEIDGILPIWRPGIAVSSDEKRIAFCYTSYQQSDILMAEIPRR